MLAVHLLCRAHSGEGQLEAAALPQIFQIAVSQNNLLVSGELVVTKSFLVDVSSICLIFKALPPSGFSSARVMKDS